MTVFVLLDSRPIAYATRRSRLLNLAIMPAMKAAPFRLGLACFAVALVVMGHPLWAGSEQDPRAHLEWMLKSLPEAPQFAQWQQRTGELPPDFAALPRTNFLPDPLTFVNGRTVRNRPDWSARR